MALQNPADEQPVEHVKVNLQIVSPSVGVSGPLHFPATPVTTTIKALKGMIRDTLPVRPADERQRLIYRGKALTRQGDSLLDVIGPEQIRAPDQHTIHLVLRDAETTSASASASASASTSTAASNQLPRPSASRPSLARPPTPARQTQPATQPPLPSALLAHQLPRPAPAAFQHQHQQLTSWLNQVQRDAAARLLVNQNQIGRAQAGMRGITDAASQGDPNSRRASPAPTADYREPYGPSLSYRTETPSRPGPVGWAFGAPVSARSSSSTSVPQQPLQTRPPLDLYLLSSPEGPRAILVNNLTLETFYSPRAIVPPLPPSPFLPQLPPQPIPLPFVPPQYYLLARPENDAFEAYQRYMLENQLAHRRRLDAERYHDRAAPVFNPAANPAPVLAQAQAQAAPAANRPNAQPLLDNRAMAGLGQLLVRLAPHLWNIARLGFFAWLFIGPNSSWTRWFVVVSGAVFIFVLGTGALNGLAEHFWRPVYRHLESLFPTLDRPQQQRPVPADQTANAEPDPADMAIRLVADRNARQPWLLQQMRRVERAGLLFLASIAPGVAERHIANLEEEARRRRQEQEVQEAMTRASEVAARDTQVSESAREAQAKSAENTANDGEGDEVPEAGPSTAAARPPRTEAASDTENNRQQAHAS